ncbi:MAG: nucleotidyltransferase family protein [Anaerolineae bacterium]|nr:nucleotidyltransferase family protein [Anaerolineae bacterium]NUQ05011.1 nucleotidyltransferase family protein [Anaerolineae bacterium]
MIAGVVLAAGVSRRMGRSKALLPWRAGETVIEAVIRALQTGGVSVVWVVGGFRLAELSTVAAPLGAVTLFNPDYAMGEMLSSLKVGLSSLPVTVAAALIALGDQPRLSPEAVKQVVEFGQQTGSDGIIAPAVETPGGVVRGHPILVPRRFWGEFLALSAGAAPREMFRRRPDLLHLALTDDDAVLSDIDTPEQYAAERQKAGLPPIELNKVREGDAERALD